MIKSFRWRLTAWYLGCFALLFSLLTAGLYGVLSRSLTGRLDENLVSQADTAAALFQDEMEESKGDAKIAAHDAVANMRLGFGKVALLEGLDVLAQSSPFNAGAVVRAGLADGSF